MRARLIFAFAFIGCFLVGVYWVSTWNDYTIDGRIQQIVIPQLMIGPPEPNKDEIKLQTIIINEQTIVTGEANDIQQLRVGQNVTVELDPDSNLKIAVSIHVRPD